MDRYRFIDGIYVYFITSTIVEWLPVFISPEPNQVIIDGLTYCIENKNLRVNAYVIMPNHIHLIVFDSNFDNQRLQQTLTDFRKFTGNQLAKFIDKKLSPTLSNAMRNHSLQDRAREVWQPGYHAEGLSSEKVWEQKMNYLHQNPVRKGLVNLPEYWRYSSADYWLNGGKAEFPLSEIKNETE